MLVNFILDEALQTKWNDDNGINTTNMPWYGYRPVSPNTINADQGTQNAATAVTGKLHKTLIIYIDNGPLSLILDGKKRLGSATTTTIAATV